MNHNWDSLRLAAALALGAVLLPVAAHAQANSWTSSSAGKWETAGNWLAGAPTNSHTAFITNAASKTVTIDSTTTNFPTTLTVSNLTVSAPLGSTNTLFLNNAGTSTPLQVLNTFTILNRGIVSITNSALRVDNAFLVNGSAVLRGGSMTVTNNELSVGAVGTFANGNLTLNGGTLLAREMIVGRNSGSVGTLAIAGGMASLSSNLFAGTGGVMAPNTGTVLVTGGQLTVTNGATVLGDLEFGANFGGVGQMTVSNGTVIAKELHVARDPDSVGTLTVAGSGALTADLLVATNSTATINFPAGTMTLRGADIQTGSTFDMGGAGQTAVLNLVAGTNRFANGLSVGDSPSSTGRLFLVNGQLLVTNNSTFVGDLGTGLMVVTNGTWRASDVFVGFFTGGSGILTVAGGTNILTSELHIGELAGATGAVSVAGGELVVTNAGTRVGFSGVGQMTISSGTYRPSGITVGFNSGSRGTLTILGASTELAAGLGVGNNAGATGNVLLAGGSLIVTNLGGFESFVGFAGVGQMTVSNGLFRVHDFRVGRNAGSQGTMTIAGGTNVFNSFLSVGTLANATGTVWITGGLVVVTNNVIDLGSGSGRLTISNGVVRAKEIRVASVLGGRGTFTIDGGTVTIDTLIVTNATSRLQFNAGRVFVTNATKVVNGQNIFVGEQPFGPAGGPGTAILNLSGVSHEFSGGFGVGLNATGEVWVTDTQLMVTNFVTVGGGRTGLLTLSNATAAIGGMAVGSSGAAVGTLTCVNSTIRLSSFLQLASFEDGPPRDVGTVWINGGQLVVTNDVTRVGTRGDGSLIVSNGTVLLKELQVATNSTARGTVTAAGGAIDVTGPVTLGFTPGATGTLWLTGGQLVATNADTLVGNSGIGQMTMSNGTWRAHIVRVGLNAGSLGTLTIAGGTTLLAERLNVADQPGSTGTVRMTGGQLVITNATSRIGRAGVGQMTIFNGTWLATNVLVGNQSGSQGSLTVAGGTNSISSGLTLGNSDCTATGIVTVTGGELRVTNSAGNAVLEVQSGTLTQSGGTLEIDRLVVTNSCARFIHTGGTLKYSRLISKSTVGDGIPDVWRAIYFGGDGSTTNSSSCATCDPDGDGQTNLEEFTIGTDPTDANSVFRITSIVVTNTTDILITWTTAPTSGNGLFLAYFVQGGTNLVTGVTNNLGPFIFVGQGAGTTTNYLDVGGATNVPPRFYRVRGLID